MHKHKDKHNHGGHSHSSSDISGKKIFFVTLLNAAITAAEIAGGLLSGSLALLSDSVHNLSDTIAVAMSYAANRIAKRPGDFNRTFGYRRAEILAAFINASVLFGISVLLIIEAVKRFRNPQSINGMLMLSVASVGLAANLLSVLLLEKDSHGNINIKSSYLHLLSDTISSVGVVLGGIAVKLWNIVWIDPLITAFISIYILKETWGIIIKTTAIFMQSSPDLNLEELKKAVEEIDGIKNIHHIHVWLYSESDIYFEAHIDMDNIKISEAEKIYEETGKILKEKYGIKHVTLQAEVDRCKEKGIIKKHNE